MTMFTKLALSCCVTILSYYTVAAQTTSKLTPEDIKSGKYSVDLEKLQVEQAKQSSTVINASQVNSTTSSAAITPTQKIEKISNQIEEVKRNLANLKSTEKEANPMITKYEQTLQVLIQQRQELENQLFKK